MSVVVAVISYNNVAKTVACIRSLERQSYKDLRILVWDNDSPDGSAGVLRSTRLAPNVDLVCAPENILWSPAVNACLDEAKEDYLVFTNNDLVFERDTIASFVKLLNDYPKAGAVVPMGAGFGGPQDYAAHKERWIAAGKGSENNFRAQGPIRIPSFVGACVCLPRSVWEKIGPLDEDMPLGADDADYALRLKHEGYEIWTDPTLNVNHASHSTAASPNWVEWGAKSWQRFNERWDGYFATEDEALRAHWGDTLDPSCTKGTGWTEDFYNARIRGFR